MSMPVTEALCIQWANVSQCLISTASTTQSAAMPAGTVAVRLISGAQFFVRADGSASVSGSGSTFVPANTAIIFECGSSAVLSFRAFTSANPMSINIAPLAA